jgi:putative FmdB family regulatory protein
MPLYDYRCRACGEETEVYRSVSADATAPQHCGQAMEQFHTRAPMGTVQAETHYLCPATGQQITSRKQRLETFRKHNLADVSDMSSAKQYERDKRKWEGIRKLANAPINELPTGYKAEDFLPAI